MATGSTHYIKGGIRIPCNTSVFPAPRTQAAWPVPAFPGVENSLLTLTRVPLANTPIGGIQVVSVGPLPGGTNASWTLFHQAYQGTPADLPAAVAIPLTLTSMQFTYLDANPLNGAVHVFWLQRIEAGQTTVYPTASIDTPEDATQAALQDLQEQIAGLGGGGLLKVASKPTVIAAHATLTAQVEALRTQCTALGGSLPDPNGLDAYLDALEPPWDDLEQDTVVPDATTWSTAWNSAFAEITSLQSQVQALLNAATGGALDQLRSYVSDNWLSIGEKSRLQGDYATAQATWETLAAGAQAAGLPYDELASAWLALSACVANLDPPLTDLVNPTSITGIPLYALWSAFDVAALQLQVKLQSTSSSVTAIAIVDLPLSGATAPVADGYDLATGDTVMLAAQVAPAENGIHQVTLTEASGPATTENGSAATSLGTGGSYINDGATRDGNDETAATLAAGNSGTSSVIFSGFSGNGIAGTIRIRITPVLGTAQANDYTAYINQLNGGH